LSRGQATERPNVHSFVKTTLTTVRAPLFRDMCGEPVFFGGRACSIRGIVGASKTALRGYDGGFTDLVYPATKRLHPEQTSLFEAGTGPLADRMGKSGHIAKRFPLSGRWRTGFDSILWSSPEAVERTSCCEHGLGRHDGTRALYARARNWFARFTTPLYGGRFAHGRLRGRHRGVTGDTDLSAPTVAEFQQEIRSTAVGARHTGRPSTSWAKMFPRIISVRRRTTAVA